MVLGKMAIEQVCSSGHNFKLAIPLSQGILVWINYDDPFIITAVTTINLNELLKLFLGE